jgi:hypothetical protein
MVGFYFYISHICAVDTSAVNLRFYFYILPLIFSVLIARLITILKFSFN